MRIKKPTVAAISALVLASLIGLSTSLTANAAGAHVRSASAAAITKLVAASKNIDQISTTIASEIASSGNDSPQRLYPSVGQACVGGTGCVFGDKHAKNSIVLFGDSHALMWLPALTGFATRNDYKLVVMWAPGKCAVALLPSNYSYSGIPNSGCSTWHRLSVAAIKKLSPKLVLLGERTTDVYLEPGNRQFTDRQWRTALDKSIRQLATKTTKVAILEDVVSFATSPQTCLAAYPTEVQQQCSVPFPNPSIPGHQQAEREAAADTGAGFIETSPWFCTNICSPVIGNFIPFYDQGHVAATYAQFLSGVVVSAIKPYL